MELQPARKDRWDAILRQGACVSSLAGNDRHYCVFGLTHWGIGTILILGMNTMLAFFY